MTSADWTSGQVDGRYTPARFSNDGFVHCTGDVETTAKVAQAYFSKATDAVLLVEIDVEKLDVALKWEAAAPPDGKAHAHHAGGKLFPHVYGSIPLTAVVGVRPYLPGSPS